MLNKIIIQDVVWNGMNCLDKLEIMLIIYYRGTIVKQEAFNSSFVMEVGLSRGEF